MSFPVGRDRTECFHYLLLYLFCYAGKNVKWFFFLLDILLLDSKTALGTDQKYIKENLDHILECI